MIVDTHQQDLCRRSAGEPAPARSDPLPARQAPGGTQGSRDRGRDLPNRQPTNLWPW